MAPFYAKFSLAVQFFMMNSCVKIMHVVAAFLVFLSWVPEVRAGDQETGTKNLPRFASLKSNTTYVRTGPSMDYPIRWIYKRAGRPVEVIHEFEAWRKIKDQDGSVGWVHKMLLSGKRSVVVSGPSPVTAWDDPLGRRAVARLEPGVIAAVTECGKDVCLLDFPPRRGWVEKKQLWGVYPLEVLN